MIFRIGVAAVGFIGALFGIVWIPISCIVLLALRFRSWEALVLGLMIDLTWMPLGTEFALPIFTVGSIFIVWALEPLRLELLG